jgi:hypothetical protein
MLQIRSSPAEIAVWRAAAEVSHQPDLSAWVRWLLNRAVSEAE